MGCGPSSRNVKVQPEQPAADQSGQLLYDTPGASNSTSESSDNVDQVQTLELVSKQAPDLTREGLTPLSFPATPPSSNGATLAASSEDQVTLPDDSEGNRTDQETLSPLSLDRSDPHGQLTSQTTPPTPNRLLHAVHPLGGSSALRACGTDSQIEFFKMLDKKIEEGPDYVPSDDES